MMIKLNVLFASVLIFLTQSPNTLKGTWEFAGGIYNGKKEGAPKDYELRRKYNDAHYEAFLIEKGYKPEKYEAGDYTLTPDSCFDTETFSREPSKITNIPIHYSISFNKDTLVLRGTLPTGMNVEEYWKRLK